MSIKPSLRCPRSFSAEEPLLGESLRDAPLSNPTPGFQQARSPRPAASCGGAGPECAGVRGFRKVPRTSGIPFSIVIPWEAASDALSRLRTAKGKLPGERRRDPAVGQTVVREGVFGAGADPRLKPRAGTETEVAFQAGGQAKAQKECGTERLLLTRAEDNAC